MELKVWCVILGAVGSHPVSTTCNRQLRNLFLPGKERGWEKQRHPRAPTVPAGPSSDCSQFWLPVLTQLHFCSQILRRLYLLSSIPSFCLSQPVVRLLSLETQSPNIVMNKQIHWSLTVLCFHMCSLDLHSQDKLSFTGLCSIAAYLVVSYIWVSQSLKPLSAPFPRAHPSFPWLLFPFCPWMKC